MNNRRFALVFALGLVLALPGLTVRPHPAVTGSMWHEQRLQIHNRAHTLDGFSAGGCHGGADVSSAPIDD